MQTINLTQNNFKMPPVVYMVQNDTGRSLKMILDDVTLAGTETGAVAIRRSDGSYYTITATLVAADNAFTIEADQALTQPGRTDCQLKVTDSNNDVISSYTFCIMVQPSTDGVSEEQLGINPQDLINAAAQLTLSDNDVKLALLQIAEKTAYIDQNGQDYYDALEDALYPPIRATSVTLNKNSLVFSGIGGTDTLVATVSPNNVEDDTVYWGSSDKDVAVVSDGIVIATGVGTATITAICNTKSASASVSVASVTLSSISAVYTQSGTVYDEDSLDSLKSDLVVTAHWSDNTQTVVASSDYTLSGTLTAGTSTITVSYGGKTTTFTVTVTATIPNAYTRYDYIQSNSTTTISASYSAQIRLKPYANLNAISCEFAYCALSGHHVGGCLWGRRTESGSTKSFAFYGGNATLGYHLHGNDSSPAVSSANGAVHIVKYTTAPSSPSSLQVDSGAATSIVWSNDNVINADPCLLANPYNNTTNINLSYGHQIGYIKIFDANGDLLNDYRPVVRDADSVIGMFDIVDQTFYTTSTTSHATIGNTNQKYIVGNWS